MRLPWWQKQAVTQFVTALEHVCTASLPASEQLLHTLGQLINMFAVLDQLKNSKASVKNDYATYKRYVTLTTNQPSSQHPRNHND